MTDGMSLNTKIVQRLLMLNEGEIWDLINVSVEKKEGETFVVRIDDEKDFYDDINNAADAIEDAGVDEADLDEELPEWVDYEVRVQMFRGSDDEYPTEDELRKAVHGGLIAGGWMNLEAIGVRKKEN